MKLVDLSGQKFNKWLVKSYAGNSRWFCVCDCGTEKTVLGSSLRRKITNSCGCYAIEVNKTHGLSNQRIYSIWESMKARCLNSSSSYWHRYGGRGIKVCDRWLSFENFFEDMGNPPSENHSLGRIDNDGNYEPQNCRWETNYEQNHNKVLNHKVTIDGVTKTLTQWAQENGLKPSTVMSRIHYKWNEVDAVTLPLIRGFKYRSLEK
jgi:hypothetical protein